MSSKRTQWVSSVLNVESKSDENMAYLRSILGPIDETNLSNYDRHEEYEASSADSLLLANDGHFQHEIVFKVKEQVFIDEVNVYEKACDDNSSLTKLEAFNSNDDSWFLMWQSDTRLLNGRNAHVFSRIFKPIITPTPFKTNTIKLSLSGSMRLIDAIEIKGSVSAAAEAAGDQKAQVGHFQNKHLEKYSLLSRDLNSLVHNELFADVLFEVEGKIVPAHRNILVCRSEYFRAMLDIDSNFKETKQLHDAPQNPIYMKNVRCDAFTQILTFLYTGHVHIEHLAFDLIISLMRLADSMNICELEQLVLYQLSELINRDNCVQMFKEAYESSPDVLKNVISLCYEVISAEFAYVSRTEDFCALSQDLMLQIIQNVVPKLSRLNSETIGNASNQSL